MLLNNPGTKTDKRSKAKCQPTLCLCMCTTDDPNKMCINGSCVCADGYSDTFNTGNCTTGESWTRISS